MDVEIWTLTVWNGSVPMMRLWAGFSKEQAQRVLDLNKKNGATFPMSISCEEGMKIPVEMFIAEAKRLESLMTLPDPSDLS